MRSGTLKTIIRGKFDFRPHASADLCENIVILRTVKLLRLRILDQNVIYEII